VIRPKCRNATRSSNRPRRSRASVPDDPCCKKGFKRDRRLDGVSTGSRDGSPKSSRDYSAARAVVISSALKLLLIITGAQLDLGNDVERPVAGSMTGWGDADKSGRRSVHPISVAGTAVFRRPD